MRLSKKSAHRILVTLGLAAPIVYLFGSLFFGLNGAHNGIEFADEPSLYQGITYEEAMTADRFSYDSFDWENEHGRRLGFSLGYFYYYLYSTGGSEVLFNCSEYGVEASTSSFESTNAGLGFAGNADTFISILGNGVQFFFNDFAGEDNLKYYMCFYLTPGSDTTVYDGVYAFVCSVTGTGSGYISEEDVYFTYGSGDSEWQYTGLSWDEVVIDDRSFHYIYFDDGAHLPEGVELNDELRSYFVPELKPQETTSKSNYIFGQFFARDNFLVQWGRNVLSDNPVGFTPFASFIRFFDGALIRGSDSQIALMLYGELYYMLHIMLFDLVYHVLVFIPNLVTGLFSKFGGGLNDE